MPSETYLNLTAPFVDVFGFSSEAILILFAILISIMMGVAFVIAFKKEGEKEHKQLGLVMFFLTLMLMAFVGVIDWIIVVVPLFLIGLLTYYRSTRVGAS